MLSYSGSFGPIQARESRSTVNISRSSVQVGDLIQYNPLKLRGVPVSTAVVLKVNTEGGTVQAIDQTGDTRWMVISGCEVISAAR